MLRPIDTGFCITALQPHAMTSDSSSSFLRRQIQTSSMGPRQRSSSRGQDRRGIQEAQAAPGEVLFGGERSGFAFRHASVAERRSA